MIVGKNIMKCTPNWKLGSIPIITENQLDILGVTFSNNYSFSQHIDNRVFYVNVVNLITAYLIVVCHIRVPQQMLNAACGIQYVSQY